MMIKASETPFPVAGGARRDKVGRPTRISPRFKSVSGATGAGAFCVAAFLASTCWAQELPWDAPPAGAAEAQPMPPAAATPVAPSPRQTNPRSTPAATDRGPAVGMPADKPASKVDSANPPTKPWPPSQVQMLSPSAPLGRKSRVSVNLVHKWENKNISPTMGPRGEVRFIFGATQDTVVCAPLRICDIALQAGEIVQNINLGDPVEWSCPPAISGSGAAEITHLMCKPANAGLTTSLAIQTSRRTYSIELVSTRANYMPLVGWSYPDDQAAQWAAYQQRGGGQDHQTIPMAGAIHYDITGDNPPWRPITAYSDGHSTYIQFPPSMAYGRPPVLERLP